MYDINSPEKECPATIMLLGGPAKLNNTRIEDPGGKRIAVRVENYVNGNHIRAIYEPDAERACAFFITLRRYHKN